VFLDADTLVFDRLDDLFGPALSTDIFDTSCLSLHIILGYARLWQKSRGVGGMKQEFKVE
jgi:hypothetical protein